MRKVLHFALIVILFIPIEISLATQASAAKTGTTCKKVNAKDWDGDKPIVCKKNSKGKLVWTLFGASSTAITTNDLTITLVEINETLPSTSDKAVWYCDNGGQNYQDIYAGTGVEVRDGNSNLLATGVLGSATVLDVGSLGSCVFKVTMKLKKSDFYQIKIGKRYDKSYSFDEMVNSKWQIALTIGK